MEKRQQIVTRKSAWAVAAMGALIALGIAMMMSVFFRFQDTIIEQQERQMLTVSHSVSSSISIYINGYFSDMTVLRASEDFVSAYEQYKKTNDNQELISCMKRYTDTRPSTVTGLCMLDNEENYLFGTEEAEQYGAGPIEHTSSQVLYFKNDDGSYCIGLALPVYQKNWLVCLLNISDMYQRIASDVRMDNEGYIMITASNGLVLMHPDNSMVGKDAFESQKPIYLDSEYVGELYDLIAHQKRAESGVKVYNSFEMVPFRGRERIQKLSAYTPAFLRDDFLTVSTVSDYSVILAPLHSSMSNMLIDVLLVFAGAMGLLSVLLYLLYRQRSYAEENRALREVNSSLEELHIREEQIQHSQRLQTIGTLTGGIAHEFSNLLTPIMGYSGMMLETLPKASEYYDDVSEIFRCSEKAKEIIQQITTLSRKNAGHGFTEISLLKFGKRLDRIASSILPANVKLVTDIQLENVWTLGNDTQLSQVVLNLCANAVHAIGDKPNGVLTIFAKSVGCEETPEGFAARGAYERYALFVFSDNGCGIEQRLRERIFEPFFTTKKAGSGTGLGLSIVQSIVEDHSGYITVESEPNMGSSFKVYLPISREDVIAVSSAVSAADVNAIPVVVVDNNPRILQMLENGLSQEGFAVAAFGKPKEAAKYIKSNFCAAVVTDYSMPQMLGTRLAVTVRSHRPQAKVLVLTTLIERDIVECKHKGVIDDYILKPAASEQVCRRLHELLQ